MQKYWLLILLLIITAPTPAWAERLKDIPNSKVRDNTWVTDLTGSLKPNTIAQVNEFINKLEKDTSAEIAVVVIRSLDGQPERQFATDLLRLLGVGKQGLNNGLLLLWVVNDRRVVVEVGYGLEGILPDGKTGAIIDSYIIPHFKAGRFDKGVLEGLEKFAAVIRGEPINMPSSAQSNSRGSPPENNGSSGRISFLEILGFLFILTGALTGAAVGYRLWRRYHRRVCPECQSSMRRIPDTDDEKMLSHSMRLEEKLDSVNYDVWKCPECSHHFLLRYPKWFSKHRRCPQCGHHTCFSQDSIHREPTTTSKGQLEVIDQCAYCTYRHVYYKEIPMLVEHSSSSGSGWGSGGSSSGSSWGGAGSSSGSFGGGSSGGGGASRGY